MAKSKTPSERVIAYQAFFQTKDGQVVLRDLEKHFHAYGHTVGKDANETFIKVGERNVILYIWSVLKVSGKDIEEMLKEERDE